MKLLAVILCAVALAVWLVPLAALAAVVSLVTIKPLN